MASWLWSYIKKYRWRMAAGLLLTIAVSILQMVTPAVSGIIVDRVIIGGQRSLLWPLVWLMIGTTFVKSLVRYGYQMIFEVVSQNSIRNIREDLYDQLQGLDHSWYDRTKTGDTMTLMTGDMDAIRHFIAWVIYQIFENAIVLISALAFLFMINAEFTLLMLSVTPFILFFAFLLSKKVGPTFHQVRAQFSRLNSLVQESIAGNRVVKAFTREDWEYSRFEEANRGYEEKNIASARVWSAFIPVLDTFSGLLPIILILSGGILIIHGKLTMGELVTFSGLIWAIAQPLSMVGWLVNDVQRFRASLERVYGLHSQKTAIVDPAAESGRQEAGHSPTSVPRGPGMALVAAPFSSAELQESGRQEAGHSPSSVPKPRRLLGRVEFRGVSFSYGDEKVLEDVSFVAEPGMTIGLLGPTGSGKSSLMKLIPRFYDVSSGQILLDGEDVRTIALETLRSNVGIALQDVFLFSDTIEGNIAFARPEASMEDVFRSASLAAADEFVTGLSDGYDTIVGERGVGLSGGQRQRISLARLLLQDPPVMVLDDTTSSVDVETEEKIRASIQELSGSGLHTLFIVAHRISSIQDADLILVLDGGRIVQRGRHEQLITEEGYYREVYRHQTGVNHGSK